MKKIDKFDLNYHRYEIQPLVLGFFQVFFLKILTVKKFSPEGVTFPMRGGNCPHVYKNLYIILLLL